MLFPHICGPFSFLWLAQLPTGFPQVAHANSESLRRCMSSRNLYLELVRVDQMVGGMAWVVQLTSTRAALLHIYMHCCTSTRMPCF
jgi:hypothetical protein